ncbi:hypothetical protein A8709_17165 [Paenibacillus pectinilyticus]|uniref:DoxX family protein n=1 Tax=Paenibacillus pectinilyticus TaxID=512399 RepID=A0A1C1A253_9BACL|nr:DoxX family protein [Paenibacillus pectinilyticus]OCT14597.1 hypothetical protein A8709_17165 [Paenibacillus pectinilyticus]
MHVVSIILQSLLALAFLMAGIGKITGSKMHVENFKKLRLPQWFRVFTGLVEFVSAAALVVGFWDASWVAAGALVIAITAIGGALAHVRAKDFLKEMFPIIFIGILAIILFFINVSDLSNFPGFN